MACADWNSVDGVSEITHEACWVPCHATSYTGMSDEKTSTTGIATATTYYDDRNDGADNDDNGDCDDPHRTAHHHRQICIRTSCWPGNTVTLS